MDLLRKCQPCVWEGGSYIDLIEVFVPFAKQFCTNPVAVTAVPVALIAQSGGSVEMTPISSEHPLSKTCHFVAGIACPACGVDPAPFNGFYGSIGFAIMPSVLDGDCAFDVMRMMLGIMLSRVARTDLRI